MTGRMIATQQKSGVAGSSGLACNICTRSDQLKLHLLNPRLIRLTRKCPTPFAQTGRAVSASSVEEAKSRLNQLAGKKYGHDLTENQKQSVRTVLKQLEASESRDMRKKELVGSNWKLLYTESTGSSGGKVGPFVGQVDQAKCTNLPFCPMQSQLQQTAYFCLPFRYFQRVSQAFTSTSCS